MHFPFVQNAKTLKEVLDLKDDPEANFSENTRKVHEAMCKKRKKEFLIFICNLSKFHTVNWPTNKICQSEL